ncbi:unnamed protein product, partial [Staurois parvus]
MSFINGTRIYSLCVLPRTQWNTDRCTGPLCEVPDHVITDWPISDHFLTSLLATCEICDHRGHMVQGYSQQPCTM